MKQLPQPQMIQLIKVEGIQKHAEDLMQDALMVHFFQHAGKEKQVEIGAMIRRS